MCIAAACLLLLSSTVCTQSTAPAVTFLVDAELRRAIETAPEEIPGQPGLYSLRLSPSSEHPVIGIRRTIPSRSELHANFTDVWYVIDGAGTLVTGGAIVGGVETAPGEIRGASISEGSARRIQKGEFAVIPAGIPHWISGVDGKEILYIVVKVPARAE
jgi:mannose-6-phosphate isomerase-like protein (cupin superfamily)